MTEDWLFQTPRSGAASVVVNNYLFITGGYNNEDERLDTTEFIVLSGASASSIITSPAATLAEAVANHCLVQVSDTELLLIGGRTDALVATNAAHTLTFVTGSIDPMGFFIPLTAASMSTPRARHSCGLMKTDLGDMVVVMGMFTK